MLKQFIFGLVLLVSLSLMLNPILAQEVIGKDELNYSASICIPKSAGHFQGNGIEGLEWDLRGYWINRDDDESQQLACSVPFDQRVQPNNETFYPIEVRVTVYDASHLHELKVWLYGVDDSGNLLNNSNILLDRAYTSNDDVGSYTLKLCANMPARARSNPDSPVVIKYRYLWLLIDVPREVYPAQRSAVIGFRVNRVPSC